MKFSKILLPILVGSILISSQNDACAYSSSNKEPLPHISPNHSLESNVWMSRGPFFQQQRYKVSAKFLGYRPGRVPWIQTKFSLSLSGIAVSIGGIGGGTVNQGTLSAKWTNNDNWISDLSGSYNISGLPLMGTISNTASCPARGKTVTSSTSKTRFF